MAKPAKAIGRGEFKTPKVSISAKASKKERAAALAALSKGIHSAAVSIETELSRLLDEALEASVWSWPRPTARKNGSFAGASRNIVDTGKLKSSKKVTTKFLQTKTTFNVAYLSPYAWMVHEGGYVQPYGRTDLRASYIPGRPWVKAVMEGGVNGVQPIDVVNRMADAVSTAWG